MYFFKSLLQQFFIIMKLDKSAAMRAIDGIKASAEEIEKRKLRREKPSEENMLWCWKHRGIW